MTSDDHSVWAGLGQRGEAAPATEGADQNDFERDSVQRTVDAASAPRPPVNPAIASPFTSWRKPGDSAPAEDLQEEEPAPTTPASENEDSMPKKPEGKVRKQRATRGAGPQFQICALLLAKGDLTREELLADVSADRNQFNSALFQAKHYGRVVFLEKEGKYHLTKEGKAWTTGGANLANQKAAAAEVSATKADKRKAEKTPKRKYTRKAATPAAPAPAAGAVALVDTRPQVLTPPSFRCAVVSDGGFFLEKAGVRIDLEPDEHARMLRYLDRMAEPTT